MFGGCCCERRLEDGRCNFFLMKDIPTGPPSNTIRTAEETKQSIEVPGERQTARQVRRLFDRYHGDKLLRASSEDCSEDYDARFKYMVRFD